jgi:glycosyltransferase involved in cell wall biosynthesis
MAAQKILILTSGPLCRNPRVGKEAVTLGGAGFDVTVMTVAAHERFEAFDRALMRGAPFRKTSLAASTLADCAAIWLARRGARFGVESARAFGPFRRLRRKALNHPADLTIVHTEIAFCIGRALLAAGRRVAADFEDWHSQDLLPGTRAGRSRRLLQKVERDLMHSADYTSTTSGAMAAALHLTLGGRRPIVITNSFPLQPAPAPRAHDGPPAFFWFSQTIGPGRGLEAFIAAWSGTRQPSRLCLLGEVSPGYRHELLRGLTASQRARLQFLPLTSPVDLPGVIARHDLGLALEPSSPPNKNLTISNKILQYLNAGLPLLATGTQGQREVLARSPGAGLVIDLADPPALAAQLDTLLADGPRRAGMGAAARRAAEETFCWEREAPILLATVRNALARPPGSAA